MDYLVQIDRSRFNDAIKAYFLWKEVNSLVRNSRTQGNNLHEAISEPLVCKVNELLLNRGSGGDAYDLENNRIIVIKGTSNFDSDSISFIPRKNFDELHFAILNQREDTFYLYNLNMNNDQLLWR